MNDKKIYIVLSHTNSYIAKSINFFTHDTYSHASLSFDYSCKNMYSFGRKYRYFPLYGIFKRENINEGLFKNKDSIIAIYELNVNSEKYNLIKEKINYIENNNKGYNIIGLLLAKFKIKLHRHKYYCSEFIYEVLSDEKIQIYDKNVILFKPEELVNNSLFKKIYEGKINEYLNIY